MRIEATIFQLTRPDFFSNLCVLCRRWTHSQILAPSPAKTPALQAEQQQQQTAAANRHAAAHYLIRRG
jgi:hypothetical protein